MAAKDEQKDTTEEKAKGGSKKKWFLIGGVLVTSVVIGVAVFLFMGGRGESEEGTEEGEKTHEAASAKKVHAIYPMEPLIVNIHDGAELRYLKIKLDFEITSPEAKAEIDPLLAPLQDAILVLLSGKQMEEITTTEGKNRLRGEIMACVGNIVPPKKITRVYFTDFVVQ